MSSICQVCVIGHVTRDIIVVKGRAPTTMPGGTAYYTAIALARLGVATTVITRVAAQDDDALLGGLRSTGVHVFCHSSVATTAYENVYPTDTLDIREQKVAAVAEPFSAGDVADIRADVVHVGTCTSKDLAPGLLSELARPDRILSVDVQGMLRNVAGRHVHLEDWPDKRTDFADIDILKADYEEARVLTGIEAPEHAAQRLAEFGPKEVIVTLGSQGSVVMDRSGICRIPPFPPSKAVDATGCGDTFMAGYIARRLAGDNTETAARFAAALATLKLEDSGPFSGCEADVRARLGKGSKA